MYENTVSVPSSDKYIFDYVVGQLSDPLSQINAVTAVTERNSRHYFSFACDEVYREVVSSDVADVVARALATGYKNLYLRTLLNVDDDNFYQNVLVNVICVFDSVVDTQAVRSVVRAGMPLYLDGYYNFRLGTMKRKWSELSQLVGANRYVLEDGDLVVEFLQYLTEQSGGKRQKMSLLLDEDGFCLFDADNKLMPAMRTLARRVSVEEEAAVNLVCMKPCKLTVYSKRAPSDLFVTVVGSLFDVTFVTV